MNERERMLIEHLHSTHLNLMNRQMACEAMLIALIDLLTHGQLVELLEQYEAGLDRLAGRIEPKDQRPELWENLRLSITDRLSSPSPQQATTAACFSATPGQPPG
jgi:hypothetical protein